MRVANLTEKLYYNPNYFVRELVFTSKKRNIGGRKKRAESIRPVERLQHEQQQRSAAYAEVGLPLPESVLEKGDKVKTEKITESQARALRTTKQKIREYFMSFFYGRNVRFLTLTFEDLPASFTLASRYVGRCFQKMNREGICDGNYIAVPEYGAKDGRLHFHCMVVMKYMRNEDLQARYWKRGFVKLERLKKGVKDPSGTRALHYILKYITKDCVAKYPNARRWLHPRGHNPKIDRTSFNTSFCAFKEAEFYLKHTGYKCIKHDCFKSEKFGQVFKSTWVKSKRGRRSETTPESIVIYLDGLFFDEGYRMLLLEGIDFGESYQDWEISLLDSRHYYTQLSEYVYRYRNPGQAAWDNIVCAYDRYLERFYRKYQDNPELLETEDISSYELCCKKRLIQSFDEFLLEHLPRIEAA